MALEGNERSSRNRSAESSLLVARTSMIGSEENAICRISFFKMRPCHALGGPFLSRRGDGGRLILN